MISDFDRRLALAAPSKRLFRTAGNRTVIRDVLSRRNTLILMIVIQQTALVQSTMISMTAANNALTLQFLAWLSERPRTYADTMSAWRTSCPRLTVWEDALAEGLVSVQSGSSMDESSVVLTPQGKAVLDSPVTRSVAAVVNVP